MENTAIELDEGGGGGQPGPSSTPVVLTRNVITSLAAGLDASDLLECYELVRSAPLHGLANSTLRVQKLAIGIRYRPKVSPTTGQLVKDPRELTLEYGPQRLGPLLNNEAMPSIQVADGGTSSFIAWDNVGKVYYTTKIATDNYISSYYMASMTGAVLENILLQAVDYAERRRFYQPFNVYSEENGKEIRSSSSGDFTRFMWQHLANLGVEIEPILPPPEYEAQVWVSSVKKVIPEPAVSHSAATFYQQLYNCIEAIATNEYSEFIPSPSPSASPAPTSSQPVSLSPTENTVSPTSATTNSLSDESSVEIDRNSTDEKVIHDVAQAEQDGEQKPIDESLVNSEDSFDGENVDISANKTLVSSNSDDGEASGEHSDGEHSDRFRRRRNRALDDAAEYGSSGDFFDEDDSDDIDLDEKEGGTETGPSVSIDTMSSSPSSDETSTSVSVNTMTPDDSVDDNTQVPTSSFTTDGDEITSGEKAKQAAEEAQHMADAAKDAAESEGDTKAADAAQAAAHAAKAAADATSNAAAQAAMDSILSGDGTMMASIIITCFTDPKYGIASVDDSGTISSEAYLYRDGSKYYQLHLSEPYLQVAKIHRPMPKANTQLENGGSGGDMVDWMLAIMVLLMMIFAVMVILQQMGYVFVESLYKFQRWFFNPTKYDYEGEFGSEQRKEYIHTFGEDGIPISMGGRLSQSPVRLRRVLSPTNSNTSDPDVEVCLPDLQSSQDYEIGPGDVELTRVPSSRNPSRNGSVGSIGSHESLEHLDELPDPLARDPGLVQFPDLKSSSKVAMPVRANGNRVPRRSYSDGYSDDGTDHLSSRRQYRDNGNDYSVGSLVTFD